MRDVAYYLYNGRIRPVLDRKGFQRGGKEGLDASVITVGYSGV